MHASLRRWSVYATGIVLFVAVGLGAPALLLERLGAVLTGLPGTPVG